MKKLLLSLFALVTVLAANAVEVTDVLDQSKTGVTGTSYTMFGPITESSGASYVGQCAGGNESIQLRSNNSNSGVVTTASAGKVTKLSVVWNSNTTNGRTLDVYGSNTAYTAATDLYNTATCGELLGSIVKGTSNELVIEGEYQYIGFRSKSSAMYLTSVSITWETGGEQTQVTKPSINPNGGEVTAESTIEITCATEGAAIYYTIDGTEPSTSSTLYSAPFSLAGPATVKAIAVDPAGTLAASSIASADFTFPVANIAEFISEARPHATTIAGAVTVVDQLGSYLFLEDATGRIVAFGSLGKTYNNGDQLTGVKGSFTLYNGLPEMNVDASSFGTATAGSAIKPVVTAVNEVSIDNLLQYVRINGVSISGSGKSYTLTDAAGNTVAMYNTAGATVETGDNFDVIGFISCYNTTVQIMPIEVIANNAADPVINPNGGEVYATSLISITCDTEGASIYYTIDGSEPSADNGTLYSEPFSLAEAATVKAIAIAAGLGNSNVVSADFTIAAGEAPKNATYYFVAPGYTGVEGCLLYNNDGSSNGENKSEETSLVNKTFTEGLVTLIFPDDASNNFSTAEIDHVRWYKNKTAEITPAKDYKVTAITLQTTGSYTKSIEYTVDGVAVGEETLDTSAKSISWTGEAYKTMVMTPSDQIRFNYIMVTVEQDPSSVEDIIVDANAPVKYFNLQGVQVANPENGVFIRVQGNQASKVLVK